MLGLRPMPPGSLERALAVLGPLEGRIMREAWTGGVGREFVVQDMRDRMPELAYTTVMSTLSRLASKGLLGAQQVRGQRAYAYSVAERPAEFLGRFGSTQVDDLVDRFGDAALAAFARRLQRLTPAQRERLRRLADR